VAAVVVRAAAAARVVAAEAVRAAGVAEAAVAAAAVAAVAAPVAAAGQAAAVEAEAAAVAPVAARHLLPNPRDHELLLRAVKLGHSGFLLAGIFPLISIFSFHPLSLLNFDRSETIPSSLVSKWEWDVAWNSTPCAG
jgi:hypothetical protein